jgi:NRAMP (natural resistance-associated macrophage protein)-like metal ion transporter
VWAGCLITAADTLTFLLIQILGVRYLEAFICVLISMMTIAFFINWGISGGSGASSDLDENLPYGWAVPTVQSWAVTQAVGTIGAVIMPHNLYLHSGLVLSRKISRNKPRRVYDAIWYGRHSTHHATPRLPARPTHTDHTPPRRYARLESAGALLVSFFINLAVVAVNADQFYAKNCAELQDGPLACMSMHAYVESGQSTTDSPTYCTLRTSGEQGVCGDFGLESEGFALADALGPCHPEWNGPRPLSIELCAGALSALR